MLFSVVDDRSGAAHQEYRCVYGEDVESGLRFLFNAMAPKEGDRPALQGVPESLYLGNGPIAKSGVFQTVMERLGVLRVMAHQPAGQDGRRPTARQGQGRAAPQPALAAARGYCWPLASRSRSSTRAVAS